MERMKEYNLSGSITVDDEGVLKYPLPEINELMINLSQLEKNYNIVKSLMKPDVKLMAVLKGNAYGHGMIPIASELEHYHCDAFGVVRLNEAFALKEAKLRTPVILLAPILPSQATFVVKYEIIPMIDNEEILDALNDAAIEHNKTVAIHIKINTGLNRYGIDPEHAVQFIKSMNRKFPNIMLEGIYTHFQNPDYNPEFTQEQLNRFQVMIQQLEEHNLRPPLVHAASSAGILRYPQAHFDMVRCGVMLFGLEHTEGEKNYPKGIHTLMTLKARIIKIRELPAGDYGGYGKQFIASKDTRIAVIGLGYGDGISRGWREALVGGIRVPVVNYFMDGILVDISSLEAPVSEFDEAVLIGYQGKEYIGWGEACKSLGKYEDEQAQYIAQRVPKRYYYE